MQNLYTDYANDTIIVKSYDKCNYVNIKFIPASKGIDKMIDLDADQVDDLIYQLKEWRRMQPISISNRQVD